MDSIQHSEFDTSELDNEFTQFLMKTKENLSSLSQKRISSGDSKESTDDEESDTAFMNFITEMKNGLPTEFENDDREESTDEEQSDSAFMKFITEMKKGLPIEFENGDTLGSPVFLKNPTILRKPASESAASDEGIERLGDSENEGSKSMLDVSINLGEMESEAQKNFQRNRNVFTQKLYHFFNRKIFNNRLPKDMSVTWSVHLRTTAGYTHCYRDKLTNTYYCRIELASKVLTSFDRLRDTLLHEMCHAAVWVVNNRQRDNHGPLWRTWANRCNLILPNVEIPTRCHNYEIDYKFTYRCKNCPWKMGRHSKCSKLLESKCPKCHGSIYCVKS